MSLKKKVLFAGAAVALLITPAASQTTAKKPGLQALNSLFAACLKQVLPNREWTAKLMLKDGCAAKDVSCVSGISAYGRSFFDAPDEPDLKIEQEVRSESVSGRHGYPYPLFVDGAGHALKKAAALEADETLAFRECAPRFGTPRYTKCMQQVFERAGKTAEAPPKKGELAVRGLPRGFWRVEDQKAGDKKWVWFHSFKVIPAPPQAVFEVDRKGRPLTVYRLINTQQTPSIRISPARPDYTPPPVDASVKGVSSEGGRIFDCAVHVLEKAGVKTVPEPN